MNKQDFDNLVDSGYTRRELCWIILTCLDIIGRNKQNYVFYSCSEFGCQNPASFYVGDKGYCLSHYDKFKGVNKTK